ncbi:MAG: alpha-glucan family phosphorylase [Epsilonproteobacteria bacterium]|nr:alpha-glucan family phosphorylase [Campylobacterota bacterium]
MITKDPSANMVLPKLPKEIENLNKIALNLWWTWNPRGKELFRSLNPYLWKESGYNPIKMLKNMDENDLIELTRNETFIKEYRYVHALFKGYMEDKNTSYQKPLPIAYFCAEFGLHHSLPIYSGGLGFLAGDILKEASDMGLPMVGVGFMYPKGYVRQIIGSDGWQQETSETIDKDTAPIERVLDKDGNHLIIQVPFIDPPVFTAVWKVNVGKTPLYLLDTDIERNDPWDREISYRLYTPDMNQRLRQEIVLGIGGYRVLEVLGIEYSILHLNEGHPAFALFERVRNFIENENMDPKEALKRVKETSVFTTHTPLQAATDVYGFDMIGKYFADYWERLKLSKEEFFNFGINPDNPYGFNMTVLGMKMCSNINAVSKKHCEVTKEIWKNLFKEQKTPIEYVTNGVHLPSWIGENLFKKLEEIFGEEWLRIEDDKDLWNKFYDLENEDLWKIHYENKIKMINFIREKVRRKWAKESIDPIIAMAEGVMLDPDILTIGFARRMTSYKRPDLILTDLERLEKLINHPSRPIQIIFAGKAHPADTPGKHIIKKTFKVAQDPKFAGRVAFVEDYGEESAKYLIKGVDIWLNNPLIPMEACGTSGMKASINGTLHLSTKDGWWIEGYNGKNGWSFGKEISDDKEDAKELYDLLENEIIPLFYDSKEKGFPEKWVEKMKEAIIDISPKFSARRMMKEYLEKFYIPISKKESVRK